MQTRITEQIQDIHQRRPSWQEPDGPMPDQAGLDWFLQQWKRHYPDNAPVPVIFPTEEGNISVEWSISEFDVDVEVDLTMHDGIWNAYHRHTQVAEEERLNLDNPDGWAWLSNRLAELQADQQP